MVKSGTAPAGAFVAGKTDQAHKFFEKPKDGKVTVKPDQPKASKVSDRPIGKKGKQPLKESKTILPPKSFRSRRMSPVLTVLLIIVLVIAAAGLIGYFGFKEQTAALYHDSLQLVGLEQPIKEPSSPLPSITPTAKLPSLEDVTFSETADPSNGESVETGGTITYTLTLHNITDDNIDGLSITDEIPQGTGDLLVLSTPTSSIDSSTEEMVNISGISLNAGQGETVRFQVTVSDKTDPSIEISNKATLAQNGSRKISNNNTPSVITITESLALETESGNENELPFPLTTETKVDAGTTETPEATPAVTTTPAATPTPTPTPTPTSTVTPAETPIKTVVVTTTPAPEETGDETSPEDMTSVKTGGSSLDLAVIFSVLAATVGLALVFLRKKLLIE